MSELRRCARCGQGTLRVVHAWQHRRAGLATGAETLELECQTCGTQVVLQPRTRIVAERLLAWLLVPAIFPSLILFSHARRMERAWSDHPVVDGAIPAPAAPRGAPALPARRCACAAPARCVAAVRQGTWDARIGLRLDYRCEACMARFQVHDVRAVVFAAAVASVLCAAGLLLLVHPPGAAVGAEAANRGFGVGLVVLGALGWLVFARRLQGRLAHPVV